MHIRHVTTDIKCFCGSNWLFSLFTDDSELIYIQSECSLGEAQMISIIPLTEKVSPWQPDAHRYRNALFFLFDTCNIDVNAINLWLPLSRPCWKMIIWNLTPKYTRVNYSLFLYFWFQVNQNLHGAISHIRTLVVLSKLQCHGVTLT